MTAFKLPLALLDFKSDVPRLMLKHGITVTITTADGTDFDFLNAFGERVETYKYYTSKTLFPDSSCTALAAEIVSELRGMVEEERMYIRDFEDMETTVI